MTHAHHLTRRLSSLGSSGLMSVTAIDVRLRREPANTGNGELLHDVEPQIDTSTIVRVPWRKTASKQSREIIAPATGSSRPDTRPIRAETRAKLITAIATGRKWLDEIITGTVTTLDQIAARENCTARQVNMTISMAFLAPDLAQAAVDGRLPRGVGVATLRDMPAAWSQQRTMLGLASPA